MKIHALLVGSFILVAGALMAPGCSSDSSGSGGSSGSGSSGSGSGNGGVYCSYSPSGTGTVCEGFDVSGTSDDSTYNKTFTDSCTTSLKGKVVSDCATKDLVGCCVTTTKAGAVSETTTACYYSDTKLTVAEVKMACGAGKFTTKP